MLVCSNVRCEVSCTTVGRQKYHRRKCFQWPLITRSTDSYRETIQSQHHKVPYSNTIARLNGQDVAFGVSDDVFVSCQFHMAGDPALQCNEQRQKEQSWDQRTIVQSKPNYPAIAKLVNWINFRTKCRWQMWSMSVHAPNSKQLPIHRLPTAVSSTISLNVNVLWKLIMGSAVAKVWRKILLLISAKCKANSHRTSLACERHSNMHNVLIDKCLTH